jgi:hypothetical protein
VDGQDEEAKRWLAAVRGQVLRHCSMAARAHHLAHLGSYAAREYLDTYLFHYQYHSLDVHKAAVAVSVLYREVAASAVCIVDQVKDPFAAHFISVEVFWK